MLTHVKPRRFVNFLAGIALLVFAPACLDSDPDRTPDGILPHPAGWSEPDRHGGEVLAAAAGAEACATSCHGADFAGGFTGIACADCHPLYPHSAGWEEPGRHGAPAFFDTLPARCGGCHGLALQGGDSGVGCFDCHPGYPHEARWEEPHRHGLKTLRAGTVDGCASACHGADFLGGLSSVSCFGCHPLYPHAPGWVEYESHGAEAKPTGSVACATLCHGADFAGGDSAVTCFACHAVYPHREWEPYGSHKPWVAENTDGSCITARGCHESYRGPTSISVGCTDYCHTTASIPPERPREKGRKRAALRPH